MEAPKFPQDLVEKAAKVPQEVAGATSVLAAKAEDQFLPALVNLQQPEETSAVELEVVLPEGIEDLEDPQRKAALLE